MSENAVMVTFIDRATGLAMHRALIATGMAWQFDLPDGAMLKSIGVVIGDEATPKVLTEVATYLESDHLRHPPGECELCDRERNALLAKIRALS